MENELTDKQVQGKLYSPDDTFRRFKTDRGNNEQEISACLTLCSSTVLGEEQMSKYL